jgi:uncharacterized membrane protein YfcA
VQWLHVYLPFVGAEFNLLLLIGIGFAVGVLAGFFGLGGGWVVTPALYSLGFPMPFAIGTGLANIAGQSALATVKHRRMGNVDYRLGLTVGVSMVAGVEAGKAVINWLYARGLAGPIVGWVYVALLAGLGAYMLRDYGRSRRAPGPGSAGKPPGDAGGRPGPQGLLALPPVLTLRSCGVRVSLWVLIGFGLGIGLLAGVLGVGGGFALVPAFVFGLHIPTLIAVGTSLLCVLVSGAYGTFTYGAQGNVEIVAVVWLFAGSILGANLGVSATRYVRGAGIRLLYAVMLLVAACGVGLTQLGTLLSRGGEAAGAAGWALALAPLVILGGALVMCLIIIGRMVVAIAGRGGDGK